MLDRLKTWARTIKRDIFALWIAARDSRVPLLAKIVAGAVAAYALSPIDLIPDFIPVFGYLDDIIIVPFGIMLAVRLIPVALMTEFRTLAQDTCVSSRDGGWMTGWGGGFDCTPAEELDCHQRTYMGCDGRAPRV